MNQFVEEDAQTPHVHQLVVLVAQNHLRGHVFRCSAEGAPRFRGIYAPPEIAELHFVLLRDEDVLWLEVPMDETMLVEEKHGSCSLDEEIECFIFRELLTFSNQSEQIPTGRQFHHQVYILIFFYGAVQPYYIWVFKPQVHFNLPFYSALHVFPPQNLLLNDFHT